MNDYTKGLILESFDRKLLGLDDFNDKKEWKQDRDTYGFDERSTWNLDMSILKTIYYMLNAYLEHTNTDTEYHIYVNYDRKEVTEQEMIDSILYDIQDIVNNCELSAGIEPRYKGIIHRLFYNLAEVMPGLWW